MSNAGKPAEEIARELQDTGAVYPLSASQIVKLHEQDVADSVLNYLQNVYAPNLRGEAHMSVRQFLLVARLFLLLPCSSRRGQAIDGGGVGLKTPIIGQTLV